MGCFINSKHATDPIAFSSMIQASKSLGHRDLVFHHSLRFALLDQLRNFTPASTASSAFPLFFKTFNIYILLLRSIQQWFKLTIGGLLIFLVLNVLSAE
jgi:hypothetical protein